MKSLLEHTKGAVIPPARSSTVQYGSSPARHTFISSVRTQQGLVLHPAHRHGVEHEKHTARTPDRSRSPMASSRSIQSDTSTRGHDAENREAAEKEREEEQREGRIALARIAPEHAARHARNAAAYTEPQLLKGPSHTCQYSSENR